MRWAKLSKDSDLSDMNVGERSHFDVFDDLQEKKGPDRLLEGIIGGKVVKIFNEWTPPGGYDFPALGFGRIAKEKYETFCGGWLRFYDDVVRNNAVNHTLHFDWDRKKRKVVIWITPASIERPGMSAQQFIKYIEPAIDPPTTPPPPPPPRDF